MLVGSDQVGSDRSSSGSEAAEDGVERRTENCDEAESLS